MYFLESIMTCKEKRDQRSYEIVQKYRSGLFLNVLISIIGELPDPYTVKAGVGGMMAYSPKMMAAVCFMLEFERTTYRSMADRLRSNHSMAKKIGFASATPSRSTISRAYGLIPESYFELVHRHIIATIGIGHAVAVDSTGFSIRRNVRWLDHKTDKVKVKREWLKLHAIIDVNTRTVLEYLISEKNVADVTALKHMFKNFANRDDMASADFCADAAYLSREVCNIADGLGMKPYIDVKKNTTSRSGGSHSWYIMVRTNRYDKEQWDEHYHQRSIIEAVFSALKTLYGSHLRCTRDDNQRKELVIRTILYNAEKTFQHRINVDALTEEMLAVKAA